MKGGYGLIESLSRNLLRVQHTLCTYPDWTTHDVTPASLVSGGDRSVPYHVRNVGCPLLSYLEAISSRPYCMKSNTRVEEAAGSRSMN